MLKRAFTPPALRWALYDFANTAFAMAVLALVFPRLYKTLWAGGLTPEHEHMAFNLTLSLSSLLVAVFAPVLAGAAEAGGLRLRLLRLFAVSGALLTAALGFVPAGCWWGASIVYVAGAVCFFCGNIFYDAMLTEVAEPADRHTVSGTAFSFGYIAGVIMLVLLGQTADLFDSGAQSAPWIFGFAGLWWFVFAIPLLTRHADKRTLHAPMPPIELAKAGLAEAWRTLKEIWAVKPLRRFLLAYIFYIDGVSTVIATAAHLGESVGFTSGEVLKAFFVVQLFGVPCALLFGWLGEKIGPRVMIAVALAFYMVVTAYGARLAPGDVHFLGLTVTPLLILAAMVGMVQGGVQALSRSYYASMIPVGRETAFFGFYSMIGKCSTVFGPVIAWIAGALFVSDKTNAASLARAGFASLSVLFLLGLVFLAMARKAERTTATATRP